MKFSVVATFALLATSVIAQPIPDDPAVAAASDLHAMANNKEVTKSSLQQQAVLSSRVGRYSDAEATYSAAGVSSSLPDILFSTEHLPSVRILDGAASIVEEAQRRRIVIINEAHHVPVHRAFVQSLLPQLYKLGYRYFACETFSSQVNAAVSASHVLPSAGYYLSDPVFAELVREAKFAGWKLIEYEAGFDPAKNGETRAIQREREQAVNLMKIFEGDPDAKILVLAGYGHGSKVSMTIKGETFKSMGKELAERSGFDPLSVDQTTFNMSIHSSPSVGPRSRLLGRLDTAPSRPFTLVNGEGKFLTYVVPPKSMDIQLIHPVYPVIEGRPAWLQSLAGRSPLRPKDVGSIRATSTLIVARRPNAAKNSVPVDSVLVKPGEPTPTLMVPPGDIDIQYFEFGK